ncbi:hypothetical protein NDU88_000542 [Pleurodeles waltl]|uniref:Uncharacterized protein n=1 Tax=Pleurodeles waltl TaxID=8319 RepID=A0AAV7URK8_PLEWA|nr:hypothetical protein NDU88_000542 [Pleurodeles waltl]
MSALRSANNSRQPGGQLGAPSVQCTAINKVRGRQAQGKDRPSCMHIKDNRAQQHEQHPCPTRRCPNGRLLQVSVERDRANTRRYLQGAQYVEK